MTIADVVKDLDDLTNDERERYLRPLVGLFSRVSLQTLRKFQTSWDFDRSGDEFFQEQAKLIRECVELETSTTGEIVRAVLGLEPLCLDTVLVVGGE